MKKSRNEFENLAGERGRKIVISLKAQQYLFDASEIETWLVEKKNVSRYTNYGRGRDSTTKLLIKHKAFELVAANYPDSKISSANQKLIEKMMKSLQKLGS